MVNAFLPLTDRTTEEPNWNDQLALRSMTAYIAHEINHPLGTITNLAGMLVRRVSDPVVRPSELIADLEAIKAETRRAAEVIRNLRVLTGGIHGHSETINVRWLLREAADRLKRRLPPGTIAIRVECCNRLLAIHGVAEMLHIALQNLLANSVDAVLRQAVRDPRITLRASAGLHRQVSILVLDNGGGIPQALKDKVFEPFVSGKDNGSGLGLAIVRDVVEWHHGSVDHVERMAKNGTCFEILLPQERH